MSQRLDPEPLEERLADLVATLHTPAGPSGWLARQLRLLGDLDRAAYQAVAGLTAPRLDAPLRGLSEFADFSRPWFATAAVLALFDGPRGRRAAATGIAAIAVTSIVVNQPMKLAGDRARPDRHDMGVPRARWVPMPASTSFPSGHSASAAAFAVSVGATRPPLVVPLGIAASIVAFSRVYTGVHYPSDVIVGAAVGALLGRLTATVARRIQLAT